ncbi:hypothetical protein HU200_031174 [Digitaria exilis]|uniref:Uncharacterized protein n=1 Tax=Digitaria exilis TaxID=1010633 RepID=A0A835C1M4_9POAL|nr:hypothetical protein HU200_031174 [Digitaria exilis]
MAHGGLHRLDAHRARCLDLDASSSLPEMSSDAPVRGHASHQATATSSPAQHPADGPAHIDANSDGARVGHGRINPDAAAEVAEKDMAAEVVEHTLPSGGGGGGTSGGARPPRKKDWTPEEHKAAKEFMKALLDDYDEYAAMSEDEIEDEYRRAGKLHKYDPEMELAKRCARVAKKHPPPPGYYPVLEQDFKLIEDDED